MNFKPYLAYSASAGSGKTFALSVRYISLLFMGESASNILAATFTNKAAAEMRHRVVSSLRNLEENEAFLDAICFETGFTKAELFAKQPEVLAKFLAGSSHIVTLDSFFSSILRSASLELGLEPDFVTKEVGVEELEQYFLEELQAQNLLSSLVKLAINIEDKRFMKIFDLMQNFYKVDPLLPKEEYVVANVKSIEAEVDSCRDRLHKLVVDAKASKTAVANFEPTDTKTLFGKSVFSKESLYEHRNYKKYVEKNPQIDELYLELKTLLAKWVRAKESVVLHSLFNIYSYYKNATISSVKSSGVLTFDDLSYFTYRLLHKSISKEFLYFKIDSKFKHILLDEFQDTSTLQFLLLQPLIDEIFAGHGQSEFHSFFYVGDTKQSLYRFRGGVEELFDKVASSYGITIEQMDTNYRSSKSVVACVNEWFKTTMEGYLPQKSLNSASDGFVEVLESEETIDEAVKQAKKLLELGADVNDIAFLVHTNSDGQTLQEACHNEGIAVLLKTSSSLKNIPKISALVSMCEYLFFREKIDAQAMLLRVGESLDDVDLSWFRVYMTPLQVLDRLVREFGYFNSDANILKLLDFASSFVDIPTFLEEFKTSRISVASSTVHGAKIMTIHGSKGLEFEYVILLDKLTRPNADKSALIYHYADDLRIDQILYRTKGRENFDDEYANIVDGRKVSALKDRKNVLYVALTRAVEGLIVIKKPEKSVFDEVNISSLSMGTMSIVKKSHTKESHFKEQEISITNYGIQERVKNEDDEAKDYEAILFGTALHYTLEMLGSFSLDSLKVSMVSLKNRYGGVLQEHSIREIELRVKSLIENSDFKKLLEGANIRKEQSLSFDGELKQIDLLLEYEDSYLVIDYKSSKKHTLKHQQQVAYYKKAIGEITGKTTNALVVYVLESGAEFLRV